MKSLFLTRQKKYYKRQDKDTKRRLNNCIDNLSREPLSGPHIKDYMVNLRVNTVMKLALSGVVYEVNVKDKTVEIKSIGGRGRYL